MALGTDRHWVRSAPARGFIPAGCLIFLSGISSRTNPRSPGTWGSNLGVCFPGPVSAVPGAASAVRPGCFAAAGGRNFTGLAFLLPGHRDPDFEDPVRGGRVDVPYRYPRLSFARSFLMADGDAQLIPVGVMPTHPAGAVLDNAAGRCGQGPAEHQARCSRCLPSPGHFRGGAAVSAARAA